MAAVELGQVWELYSPAEGRWVRVIVAKIAGDLATRRYEGTFQFLTVDVMGLQSNPNVSRRAGQDCAPFH
jgi:hypothetical protein